jgi:ABC-type amino acid transport substrate-binding protein
MSCGGRSGFIVSAPLPVSADDLFAVRVNVSGLGTQNTLQTNVFFALEVVETYATGEVYGFAAAPDDQELIEEVNAALADIRDDGTYDALFDEWISAEWFGEDAE